MLHAIAADSLVIHAAAYPKRTPRGSERWLSA
jgi:hypothetical protein